MGNSIKRFDKLLTTDKTALLIIDIQEKIICVINEYETVVENTIKLIKGFKALEIPIYYTEQYPKGLGPTVESIQNELEGNEAIQKLTFSCSGAGELFIELKKNGISQVAVCGVESHVCVQQTVLDLLANDFQVNLAVDAVSSRKVKDYEISLSRMRQYGADITTAEAILFELLNVSGTDTFKQISKIVK
ncbi:MAG: isochorismatase family protein [Bacteroidetes bacterium]|nr:isochorismatase family protein [Bacteroidota bacterium]